jgi:hypothetical protein
LPIPFRAASVALLSIRLSTQMPRLIRVLMERAFRAAGSAVMSEVLTQALREARAEALAGALI